MKRYPLITAGIIFAIVALIHLARLYYHFPIIIGNTLVPSWVNVIAFLVTGCLSLWMFYAAKDEG